MSKSVKFDVNGKEYTIQKMGAIRSLGLATKISKIVEPLVKGGDLETVNLASILLGAMGNPEVPKLIQELTAGKGSDAVVYYDGMSVDFDSHYADFPEDLLPVLAQSLKENVMSFFPASALTTLIEILAPQDQ